MSYSSIFGKAAGAVVLVGGLTACGSFPVNKSEYVPANPNQVVAIDRCADNGFHVAPANSYNMAQVQQNRNYNRYGGNLFNSFANNGGISSQLINTANGPYIIQYPKSFGIDSGVFNTLAGAVTGGAIGNSLGGNWATAVGAVVGATVLSPVIEYVTDKVAEPSRREKHFRLAECISDLKASNGGYGRPQYGGDQYNGGGGYFGNNPPPRPR